MARWRKVVVAAGAAVILAAAALAVGAVGWRRSTAEQTRRLLAASSGGAGAAFAPEELEGLPRPVVRYFRAVLPEGRPPIRSVRLVQRGEFRIGGPEAAWRPLAATQVYSVRPPGFVWDARIRMAPGMAVRVRDRYLGGEGAMAGKLLGLIPLLDLRGGREVGEAALQRYLAEAVWFPTALLPSQGVRWRGIGDRAALASLTDAGVTAELQFQFDAGGEAVGVYAPARYREVGGSYEPTPWVGRFGDYQLRGGVRIPLEAEVEWRLPEGPLPYWRARIVDVEYDLID